MPATIHQRQAYSARRDRKPRRQVPSVVDWPTARRAAATLVGCVMVFIVMLFFSYADVLKTQ